MLCKNQAIRGSAVATFLRYASERLRRPYYPCHDYNSKLRLYKSKMLKLFSSLSLLSLLNNPHHFFRLNNERLDWKILDVTSYKKCFVRLARIHCNFVKNNIVWISGLFFGCNAGKFFAVFYNVLNDSINYCIGKFKLL